MSEQPTLVFIPGSWHKPTCYDKVTKILQEEYKLRYVYVTLPSTQGDPEAGLKDDIDAAREAISKETTAGRNVVVIAHSYGGMVGNSSIKGFAKPRDAIADGTKSPASSKNQEGYVIGEILIASGYTFTGLAFMDPFLGHPPPAWRVNKETGFADIVIPPRQFFYHDVPEEEVDYWISQLTTHSLKSLFEGGEHAYAGWMDVPSWYIGTIEDQGLPVVAQRMAIGMAREMGASVEHRELQTSHSPFLSKPEETAGIIVEAVEAFSGKAVEIPTKIQDRLARLIAPEPRLWQPITWYRFGLPLFFGHFLARCYRVFSWTRSLWRSK